MKLSLERAIDDLVDALRFTASGSDARRNLQRKIRALKNEIQKINEAYRNRRACLL